MSQDFTLDFPTASADVTAEWLTKQVGETVTEFEINKVGMGFTADAHKIKYNGKTVILKLPSAVGEAKQKTHALECKVEVLLYKDFAAKLAGVMKLPKVYAANTDPAAPHRWNILMEDLTAGSLEEFPTAFLFGKAVVPDVIELTNQLLSNLAKMHGKFWQDEETFKDPIFSVQEPLTPGGKCSAGFVAQACKVYTEQDFRGSGKTVNLVVIELLEKFGGPDTDVLKCKDIFSAKNGKFYEFCKTMHTPAVKDTMHHIIGQIEARPHTVIHGDAHLGNIFLDRAAGEMTWIDFQYLCRAPIGLELMQATTNLDVQDITPACKFYYAELLKAGPAGLAEQYSFEDMWQDLRYTAFCCGLGLVQAYMPDVIPMVAGAAVEDPEGMALVGWQLRCARWGDLFELVDIYSLPAEVAALKSATA
jgi:hypothetical protein